MGNPSRIIVAAFIAISMLIASCTDAPSVSGCRSLSDCDTGSVCVESNCLGQPGFVCATNSDCLDVCVLGVCATASGNNEPCDEDADCVTGMRCGSGMCRPPGWAGLGGSDFGPWETFLTWGSSAGGGISNGVGDGIDKSLVVDDLGRPVVVWLQTFLTGSFWGSVYVRRFNGVRWVEVGQGSASGLGVSGSIGSGTGGGPEIALDNVGNPVVAWSSFQEIYVRRFDGTRWVEVGVGSGSGGGISGVGSSTPHVSSVGPALAIDSQGNPVVAWGSVETSGYSSVAFWIKRYDGSQWVEVGTGSATGPGISPPGSISFFRALALDQADNPVVAWTEMPLGPGGGSTAVYVLRYDGTDWLELGAGSASGGGISGMNGWVIRSCIAIDSTNSPVIAWSGDSTGTKQVYVHRFNGSNWIELGAGAGSGGGISASAGDSFVFSLVLDSADNAVVTWADMVSNVPFVHIRRYDGQAWSDLDPGSALGSGISTRPGTGPAVGLDSVGNPLVSWMAIEPGNRSEVFVRRFDGTAWVDLGTSNSIDGGLGRSSANASDPAVAILPTGEPFVAWSGNTAGRSQIYMQRFADGGWLDVGVSSSSAGGISDTSEFSGDPSIVVDPDGNPVVAWRDSTSVQADVYVKRFDGSDWIEVGAGSGSGGGISNDPVRSYNQSLALNLSGNPVVAWLSKVDSTTSSPSAIYVRRFDGGVWVEVGAGSASGNGIFSGPQYTVGTPSIAVDAFENPAVVWSAESGGNDEILGLRFDGSSWVELGAGGATGGGISNTTGQSQSPDIARDSTGRLVVTWQDDTSGDWEIFARRLEASVWTELGTGSASGTGVSNSSGPAVSPSITVDAADRPVLAWMDSGSGDIQVYVRRFDGTSWVEVAAGSASGGGVSNSVSASAAPDVAFAGGRLCAVWREPAEDMGHRVLLRCTDE